MSLQDMPGDARPFRSKKRPSNKLIIEALRKYRGVLAPVGRALGVTRQSVSAWIENDAELRAVAIEAREELLDVGEEKLFEQIDKGDAKSIHFLLRTVGKHRGYAERVEIAGTPGQPLEVSQTHKVDLSALSADELKQLEHILSKAAAPAIDANVVDVQAIEYQPETGD